MSTRSPGRRGAPAASAPTPALAGNTLLDLMTDSGREQVALCMDAWAAMFRGFEAMRAIGQRAAQETSARHQAAAHRLGHRAGASELLALPWTIWQDDLAGATRYWQEVAAAALEAQTEVLGCACSHVFDSESALHGVAAMEALEAFPAVRTLVDASAAIARDTLRH